MDGWLLLIVILIIILISPFIASVTRWHKALVD